MVSRHVRDKAYSAVRTLALVDEGIEARVSLAWSGELQSVDPAEDGLSEELREEYAALVAIVGERDGRQRSMSELSMSELHDLAEAMLDFFVHVERQHADDEGR